MIFISKPSGLMRVMGMVNLKWRLLLQEISIRKRSRRKKLTIQPTTKIKLTLGSKSTGILLKMTPAAGRLSSIRTPIGKNSSLFTVSGSTKLDEGANSFHL